MLKWTELNHISQYEVLWILMKQYESISVWRNWMLFIWIRMNQFEWKGIRFESKMRWNAPKSIEINRSHTIWISWNRKECIWTKTIRSTMDHSEAIWIRVKLNWNKLLKVQWRKLSNWIEMYFKELKGMKVNRNLLKRSWRLSKWIELL